MSNITTNAEPGRHFTQPRPPAANAIKHGFRATKYLDPAILAAAEIIRADLVDLHDPVTELETDVVEDLAIARTRYEAIQRAIDSDLAHHRNQARKAFEDAGLRRLKIDLEDISAHSALDLETLGQHFETARWITAQWADIAQALAPDRAGITFEQAVFVCAALGSHWKVGLANERGAWVMARFVMQSLEPEAESNRWITLSGGTTDASRARWHIERAPDAPTSRLQLLTEAQAGLERWTQKLALLRPAHEAQAATAADRVLPGTNGGVTIRYLAEARCQIDRLQRRLDALRKGRHLHMQRCARKTRTETRQEIRELARALADECDDSPETPPERPADPISESGFMPNFPNGTALSPASPAAESALLTPVSLTAEMPCSTPADEPGNGPLGEMFRALCPQRPDRASAQAEGSLATRPNVIVTNDAKTATDRSGSIRPPAVASSGIEIAPWSAVRESPWSTSPVGDSGDPLAGRFSRSSSLWSFRSMLARIGLKTSSVRRWFGARHRAGFPGRCIDPNRPFLEKIRSI